MSEKLLFLDQNLDSRGSLVILIDSIMTRRLLWAARKLRLNIAKSDLVLDAGSGDNPHWRADVLCDKFLLDDFGRGERGIVLDRPFVVGDIEHLPFLNQSFDYIICTAVLEHLNNPSLAMQELMRAGKRGYIEVPTELAEKIQGYRDHKWFIRKDGQKLIFTRKARPLFDQFLADTFYTMFIAGNRGLLYFQWYNRNMYYHRVEWNHSINYEVLQPGSEGPEASKNFTEPKLDNIDSLEDSLRFMAGDESGGNRHFRLGKELLRQFCYPRKQIDLARLLACPVCQTGVTYAEDQRFVICLNCQRKYPVVGEIPIMLIEKAIPISEGGV